MIFGISGVDQRRENERATNGEIKMLTELGKLLRKLRIDEGERLLDMAEKLGVTSSFLSAVEMGRKAPPRGIEEAIIETYRVSDELADGLCKAADDERESFVLKPKSELARDTAGLLSRKIDDLSSDQLRSIQEILRRSKKH